MTTSNVQKNRKKKKCFGLGCVSKKRRKEIASLGAQKINKMGLGKHFDSVSARAAAQIRWKDKK